MPIALHITFFCFFLCLYIVSMGEIIARNKEEKSQLATEICEISTLAIACANSHHPHTKKSPFINWYFVLRVNENADIYVIRKQYHKLALQLHPDKNKHSKAEAAFKLVYEAYFCLSDKARRSAFDSERHSTISCTKCNNNTNPPNIIKIEKPHQEPSRFNRIIHKRIKEIRTKLKEEANIIEKCLITASRRQLVRNANGTKTELPVFNPSDYYQNNGGSPQNRTINHKQMEDLRASFRMGNSSPVFQYRSERVSFMSSSTR